MMVTLVVAFPVESAHGGHAMNKFVAYATHRLGAISAVEDTTLDENGLHDVVTSA